MLLQGETIPFTAPILTHQKYGHMGIRALYNEKARALPPFPLHPHCVKYYPELGYI